MIEQRFNTVADDPVLDDRVTRVLHVTYDMGIGGTEQVICQLLDGLDPQQYVCEIACIEDNIGPLGERLQADGVLIHTLNRVPGFDRSLVRKLRQIYRSSSIDVVHCHQYTPYVYGVLAAMLTGVKVVFTEHGRHYPDRYSWKRRLVNPILNTLTARIVAISEATADALAHFEWFRRGGISVVYNGMAAGQRDPHRAKRREHGIADDKLVYGTISRFDAVKNLPLLVNAFAQVCRSNPGVVLLLVGDGDERSAIEQLVRELGIEHAVVFCGYQTDTAAYMSAIDVFLLPSLTEGTSMTLLEAMSMSVCCIVTDVGGNPEIVERDKTGLVVPSADLGALVEAMRTVAEDESTRGTLARNGSERFHNKFTLTNMIEQYHQLYQSLRH
jgi:glycosyltransferase involved in cell wall biosynthesis